MQAAVCVFVRLLRALAQTAEASRARSSRYVRHVRALTAALAHCLHAYAPERSHRIALLVFSIHVLVQSCSAYMYSYSIQLYCTSTAHFRYCVRTLGRCQVAYKRAEVLD